MGSTLGTIQHRSKQVKRSGSGTVAGSQYLPGLKPCPERVVRQGVRELESGHAVTKEWNRNDAVHRSKKAPRVVLFLGTCMCGFLLNT